MTNGDASPDAVADRLVPLVARQENLTSQVFAAVRDMIIDASLPPGSSVSEASLSSQLAVSKTPVREALLRLRHIGLVEPTTRGLRVVQPSMQRIRDAFEYRAGLESVAGQYAAERGSKEQHQQILRSAKASLSAARDGRNEDFHSSDREFHMCVAEASGNDVLSSALEDCFILTSALRQRDVRVARDFTVDAQEHVSIANLLRAGKSEQAAVGLASHIHRIMTLLLELYPGATADVRSTNRLSV